MMRRVHTLRLRARDEQLIHRGAVLVEDALRTATLPGTRRLLLVRSLDLGRIDPRCSSVAVALRLEAALAALPAVYADTPRAGQAPAVYFRDEVEPYAVAIVRLLRGQPAREWFWPSALPGWGLLPRSAAAAAPLLQHASGTHGPAAAVAVLAEIHEKHALTALLDVLPAGAGPSLLAAFGWQVEPAPPPSHGEVAPHLLWPVRPFVERWGSAEAISHWLVAAALAAQAPARLGSPGQLMRTAAAVLAQMAAPQPEPPPNAARHPAAAPRSEPAGPDGVSGAAEQDARPSAPAPEPAVAAPGAGLLRAWSAGAGLSVLVNILARLGLPQLLEQVPDLAGCAFPQRLFLHFADYIGLPPNDPLRPVFALPGDASAPPESLEIERQREDGGSLPETVTWAGFLQAWEDSVAGWLARFAEIELIELIARPGYLHVTRTHLDIFFRHDQADIRIRRAGIDINPGWTPWLGRVITFHYSSDPSAGED